MNKQMLVAGGGIGGLAAALAAARAGWGVRLYEQAPVFEEVGAGVQLGPNVTRILAAWGLMPELDRVAAHPDRIQAFDGRSGASLAALPLGARCLQRYGAPYVTVHRAALHALLLRAVAPLPGVWLRLNTEVQGFRQRDGVVSLDVVTVPDPTAPAGMAGAGGAGSGADAGAALAPARAGGDEDVSAKLRRTTRPAEATARTRCHTVEGDVLLGADGLWSRVREQLLHDGAPAFTGHLAYRATVPQAQLPARLRSGQVCVWLAPRLHAVAYPVSAGEALNLVVIVEGEKPAGDPRSWDHSAHAAQLQAQLRGHAPALRDLVEAVPHWRLWPLHDRAPMQSPHDHGQGLVALLGDAAHPMRPYLAQGAGMAIEDAHALGRAFAMAETGVPMDNLLRHYALNRWARNARVQARSRRNGRIFHATGPVRWGRNLAMRLLGERLMDVPWLYRGLDVDLSR